MTRVKIVSFVRSGSTFVPVEDLDRYEGHPDHVAGAISLIVNEKELLGTELWDDINWLWPYIIQALDEYRRSGSGKRGFPDQPISFTAETAWAGTATLMVSDGGSIRRSSTAPDEDLFLEVSRAAMLFFDELQRLCPGNSVGVAERRVIESWR